MLDFSGFINSNVNLTAKQKLALLEDYCSAQGYQKILVDPDGVVTPNPQTKQDFFNKNLSEYIKFTINRYRRKVSEELAKKTATWDELEL